MNLPIGFQLDGQTKAYSDRHYVLKLNKNIYGLKQGSFNCYEKLKTPLVNRNIKLSDNETCLYIGNGMIVLTYVDNCIIFGTSTQKIDAFVKSMEVGPEIFTLTSDGDIDKFLGIEINHLDEKIFKNSQPFLIDRIISFLKIDTNEFGLGTNSKSMPVGKNL